MPNNWKTEAERQAHWDQQLRELRANAQVLDTPATRSGRNNGRSKKTN